MIRKRKINDVVVGEDDVEEWWNWMRRRRYELVDGSLTEHRNGVELIEVLEKNDEKEVNKFSRMRWYLKGVCGDDALVDYHFFPSYLSGSAYVLSKHAAIQLSAISSKYPPFLFEDVHVTGILAHKTKTKLVHSDLFKIHKEEEFKVCSNQISCHYVTKIGMYRIWRSYMASKCF